MTSVYQTSLIEKSFVNTGKLSHQFMKNLVSDRQLLCSLSKFTGHKCDDSCKIVDLANNAIQSERSKQFLIVGSVLSKSIHNDQTAEKNFKNDLQQLTSFDQDSEIITESQLRKLLAQTCNSNEEDIDVLKTIKNGKIAIFESDAKQIHQTCPQDKECLDDWGLRLHKQWFVANELIWELDPVWANIREEVRSMASKCQVMASHFNSVILSHKTLERSLSFVLSSMMQTTTMNALQWYNVFCEVMTQDESIQKAIRCDLKNIMERDPACDKYAHALLYFKGFQGVTIYRVAHHLYNNGQQDLAYALQSKTSEVIGMSIHPAAKVGKGVMFDHAQGIVVGETAVIGNNCTIFHNVYLGGLGTGERHPKLGENVVIGANSCVVGNITIGDNSKIAANTVLKENIPANVTVAGVPARIMGRKKKILTQAKL